MQKLKHSLIKKIILSYFPFTKKLEILKHSKKYQQEFKIKKEFYMFSSKFYEKLENFYFDGDFIISKNLNYQEIKNILIECLNIFVKEKNFLRFYLKPSLNIIYIFDIIKNIKNKVGISIDEKNIFFTNNKIKEIEKFSNIKSLILLENIENQIYLKNLINLNQIEKIIFSRNFLIKKFNEFNFMYFLKKGNFNFFEDISNRGLKNFELIFNYFEKFKIDNLKKKLCLLFFEKNCIKITKKLDKFNNFILKIKFNNKFPVYLTKIFLKFFFNFDKKNFLYLDLTNYYQFNYFQFFQKNENESKKFYLKIENLKISSKLKNIKFNEKNFFFPENLCNLINLIIKIELPFKFIENIIKNNQNLNFLNIKLKNENKNFIKIVDLLNSLNFLNNLILNVVLNNEKNEILSKNLKLKNLLKLKIYHSENLNLEKLLKNNPKINNLTLKFKNQTNENNFHIKINENFVLKSLNLINYKKIGNFLNEILKFKNLNLLTFNEFEDCSLENLKKIKFLLDQNVNLKINLKVDKIINLLFEKIFGKNFKNNQRLLLTDLKKDKN